MKTWQEFAQELLEKMGISDFKVDVDAEHNHGSLHIYDNPGFIKDNLPLIIESINHIAQLYARKNGTTAMYFDVNNYRKERENLISELARTAARKVVATKQDLSLPVMNSYERRLVHTELAANPSVKTESTGAGKARYVVIRPISE